MTPASKPTLARLRRYDARGRLASYKIPTAVEVVDVLPRNASGKVVKGALRERFGS